MKKGFLNDKYIVAILLLSVVAFLFSIAIFYIYLAPFQNNIILHRDVQNKIDVFGNNLDLIMILITILMVMIINSVIAYGLYIREKMLSYIVVYSIFIVSFIGALVFYFFYLFN